jgi:hypothetical protein
MTRPFKLQPFFRRDTLPFLLVVSPFVIVFIVFIALGIYALL